jgi:hypothetical protein
LKAARRQLVALLDKRYGEQWRTALRQATIDSAKLAQLETWFEKAIDAPSAAEVFKS